MEQRLVHDDDPVAGVGGDVAEIVGAQARVERVEHRAHQRDREVQLEMLGLVPEQRGDAIAGIDAETGQARRKPSRPLRARPDLGAPDRAVAQARDHFTPRAQLLRALDERRQR